MPRFIITDQYVVRGEDLRDANAKIARFNSDLAFRREQESVPEPLVTRTTLSFFDPNAAKTSMEEFLSGVAGEVLRAESASDRENVALGIAGQLRKIGFVAAADLVMADIPTFDNGEDDAEGSSSIFEGFPDVVGAYEAGISDAIEEERRKHAPEALGGRF